MNRHTSQIKALLQSKTLNKNKFNPEYSTKHIRLSIPQTGIFKRSESSSNLKRQQSLEFLIIQERYKNLQQNYRNLLEETKTKTELFKKQKLELEKYQIQSQKDKNQIERLRSMLGFIKKNDFAVQVGNNFSNQTENNNKHKASIQKNISNLQKVQKGERSTDVSNISMHSIIQKSKRKEKLKMKTSQSNFYGSAKLLSNKSQTSINFNLPLKESNIKSMKSPLSKYKFVPTFALY